jgi:hypothetical protein
LLSIVIALPATFVLHEAVHALAFKAFGGRPRFGAGATWGMPYLYASAPGQRFTRDRFLVIGLAPLVVLDLVGLLLMAPGTTAFFGAAVVVINTSAAVGDIWFAAVLAQSPRWIEVEDDGPTNTAWAPPQREEEAARLRPPRGIDLPAARWLTPWWATAVVVMILFGPLLGLTVRRPGDRLAIGPLVLAQAQPHRLIVNIPGALLLAGLVAALLVLAYGVGRSTWQRRGR